jgi:hypothetical protein
VLAGLSWVGAAASFGLATVALAGQGHELRDFTLRVAPRLNRLCLVCAVLIPLTGVANFAYAAQHRGGPLPTEFVEIVAVKLGLYALMAWMLWRATERIVTARLVSSNATVEDDARALQGLARLYGLMVAAGSIALILGLWLAGV